MSFVQRISEKAQEKAARLVLPEATDERVLKAASLILKRRLASEVTLAGPAEPVLERADHLGLDLTGVRFSNPEDSSAFKDFARDFYELRKHRGMTQEQAETLIRRPVNWGAMLVRHGQADAMVAGADLPTSDVLRAGLLIIQTRPDVKNASSCFVMEHRDPAWGHRGQMIFSDCATIPEPTAEQLADITLHAAESCRVFLETEPVIALLSFSTMGSASSPQVEKVKEALKLVKIREPRLIVDGEMQLDAAVVQEVALKKAPGSPVAGKANTLIFPDLQSGNIGYKLVQRFASAHAYGPFMSGFNRPIADLSRGCSVEDIVYTSAAVLSQVKS